MYAHQCEARVLGRARARRRASPGGTTADQNVNMEQQTRQNNRETRNLPVSLLREQNFVATMENVSVLRK